jgi:hypothetical protein
MYEIGIMLFGQPRYYNIVKKYYDEAFPDCKIDYFIHTWNIDSVDGRNQFPDEHWKPYNIKDEASASDPWIIRYEPKKLKQDLQDIYNTKKVSDRDENIIVSDYDRHVHGLRRVPDLENGKLYVHQWRSFEKVSNLLKRSKKEYDLILCSRLDLIFEPKADLIKRLLHVIEKNKSPDDELIICCTFPHGSENTDFEGMYDWLWFGTKKGMIKFGQNFTRNQITDPKFLDRGYRVRWGDQLKRNRVPVYLIPDHKWEHNWGVATLIKPDCPGFDIETIKNYSRYHENNTRGKIELEDLKPYDPKIKYWMDSELPNGDYNPKIHDCNIIRESLFYETELASNESFERSVARSPYAYNPKLINQDTLNSLNGYLRNVERDFDFSDKKDESADKKDESVHLDPGGVVVFQNDGW